MSSASIHMLYHGKGDADFRGWLIDHGVVLHEHQPEWREKLEDMRRAVTERLFLARSNSSHLLNDSGNYFGTFQRIDIPQILSVEYCILLESDALIVRPFTIADLGRMPAGSALSADLDEKDKKHKNAGVALLNVPFLRTTLTNFTNFVFSKTDKDFVSAPGGQGAFLDFYEKSISSLNAEFNMKPYYTDSTIWNKSYIIHYRGLKPHEQIAHWFGKTCEPSKCDLIKRSRNAPYQCHAMLMFAKTAALEGGDIINEYCKTSLTVHSDLCIDLLNDMAHFPRERSCNNYLLTVIGHNHLRASDFPNIG